MTKAQTIVRMLTDKRNGVWREPEGKPPYGENLRCPLCQKHGMKVMVGHRKNTPVVFCTRCHAKGNPLINAIREETGIWLAPKPRRVPPQKLVAQMRRSPEYEALRLGRRRWSIIWSRLTSAASRTAGSAGPEPN